MAKESQIQNFQHLLKILTENNIDFVIIGGFAGVLHGSSIVTRDLDLCAILTKANIEKLRSCLKDIHPKHRMTPQRLSFLEYPKNISNLKNLYLETDLGDIDLISQVTGIGDFKKLSQRSQRIKLFGYPCKIMALEDLILAKQEMGREKDLAMIKELKIIQKKNG